MNKAPVLLSFLLWGCVYATQETPVNYQYSGPSVSSKSVQAQYGIAVTQVTDARAMRDPRLILGLTLSWGGYAAEEPIAEIVRKGIIVALEQAGYSQGDELAMECTIGVFDYSSWSGLLSLKKATLDLPITVTLRRGREEIAKNTVIGQSTMLEDEISQQSHNEHIVTLFTRSLDDAIFQIVELVNFSVNH